MEPKPKPTIWSWWWGVGGWQGKLGFCRGFVLGNGVVENKEFWRREGKSYLGVKKERLGGGGETPTNTF